MEIRLMIADDHRSIMESFKAVFAVKAPEIKVVIEAVSGVDLVRAADENPADLYLVDIAMQGLDGISLTPQLTKIDAMAKIMLMSMYSERKYIEKGLKAGAKGYFFKGDTMDELIKGLRALMNGEKYLSPSVAHYMHDGVVEPVSRRRRDSLTARERMIVQLVAQGKRSKEIADTLGIAYNTVRVHRNNVMRKLDIRKETELVHYAIKEGMIHF